MATCSTERGEYLKAMREAQEAREKKMDALDAAMKRDRVMSKIAVNGGIKNAAETLHGLLRGTYKNIKDAADSVQSKWLSKREQYSALFNEELRKNNLTKAFNSGLMDKDVYAAMYKLQNGEKVGNSPISMLAKIIIHFTDAARDDVNAVGGRIKDARDYAIATSHDSDKLRAAAGSGKTLDEAFNAWYNDVKQWMSPKTFIGYVPNKGESFVAMQMRVMRDMYDSLYTGVHEKIGSTESGFIPKDFENTLNVSNKVSAHRAIVWKDGESAYSYSQKYGKSPNLASTVSSIFDRMAKAGALMEKFGNNPMANLNMVMRRIEETYKSDGDAVRDFRDKTTNIRNEMAAIDGTANIPANMGFVAKAAPVIRALENTMHLGGVMWTHFFSGIYAIPNMAAHNGINRLSAFGNLVESIFKGKPSGDYASIAAEIGAHGDSMYRHQANIFGEDTFPGKVSSFVSKYMSATGINFLSDRWKAGIKGMLSENLASNIGTKFDALEPHLQKQLSRYGINANEWSVIQKAGENLREFNGNKYLTPTSIMEGGHPDARGIADKILSYYSDAAREGIVTPGIKEQALMYGNLRKGTLSSEGVKFLMQFKAWPFAAINQILERNIYQSLSKKEVVYNMGMLVALGVPAGYARMCMNAKLAGQPVPNPLSIKTVLQATANSGALGILGDELFGQIQRMGTQGIAALGGPVVGDANDIISLYGKAMGDAEGEKHKLWPDLAHLAVNHVPFANLFYVKGAYDYLLAYHLLEAASPGWWDRTNQRLKKETGNTMVGYVPGAGVPWGVPGVYLAKGNASSGLLGNGKLDSQVH
jgi:hypothetical protein